MINCDQYSKPIASDDNFNEVFFEDWVCNRCAYNHENKVCLNVQEVDAQCDTCQSKSECLHFNQSGAQ